MASMSDVAADFLENDHRDHRGAQRTENQISVFLDELGGETAKAGF
jgi:hypothetical protein